MAASEITLTCKVRPIMFRILKVVWFFQIIFGREISVPDWAFKWEVKSGI